MSNEKCFFKKLVILSFVLVLLLSSIYPVLGYGPGDADNIDPGEGSDDSGNDIPSETEQNILNMISDFEQSSLYEAPASGEPMIYALSDGEGGLNCYTTSGSGESRSLQQLEVTSGPVSIPDSNLAGLCSSDSDGDIVGPGNVDISIPLSKDPGPYFEFSPLVENHDTTAIGTFKIGGGKFGECENYKLSWDADWMNIEPSFGVLGGPFVNGVGFVESIKHTVYVDASHLSPGSYDGIIDVTYGKFDSRGNPIPGLSGTKKCPVKLTVWADPDDGPSLRYRVLGFKSLRDICGEGYEHGRFSVILDVWNEGGSYSDIKEPAFEVKADDPRQDLIDCCSLYSLNTDKLGSDIIEDDPFHGRTVCGKKLMVSLDDDVAESLGDDAFGHHLVKASVRSMGHYNTYGHSDGYYRFYGASYTPITITTPEGYTYEIDVGGEIRSDDQFPRHVSVQLVKNGELVEVLDFYHANPKLSNPYMKDAVTGKSISKGCGQDGNFEIDLGKVYVDGRGNLLGSSPSCYLQLFAASPYYWDSKPVYAHSYQIRPWPMSPNQDYIQWDKEGNWKEKSNYVCPLVPITPTKGILAAYGSPFGESEVERRNRDTLGVKVREMFNGKPFTLPAGHYVVPMKIYNWLLTPLPVQMLGVGAVVTFSFDVVESKDDPYRDSEVLTYNPDAWSIGKTTGMMDYQVFKFNRLNGKDSINNKEDSILYSTLSNFQFHKLCGVFVNGGSKCADQPSSIKMPDFDMYPKKGVATWYNFGESSDFEFADVNELKNEEESSSLFTDTLLGVSYPFKGNDDNADEEIGCILNEWNANSGPPSVKIFGWKLYTLAEIPELAALMCLAPWANVDQIGLAFIEAQPTSQSKMMKLFASDGRTDDENDDDDDVTPGDDDDDNTPPADDGDSEQTITDLIQKFKNKEISFIELILGIISLLFS